MYSTVDGTLNAETVDASGQLSNVHIVVGDNDNENAPIGQDIKLGTGDDIVTFNGLDELDNSDTISDLEGDDIIRAAFSQDSALDLQGIETLQVTATDDVELDMAKTDVTTFALLSDRAVDGSEDKDVNGVEEMNVRMQVKLTKSSH